MGTKLSISYDEVGDILRLDTVKPSRRQESVHLGPDILGRLNRETGAVENLEVLFFSEKVRKGRGIALPVLVEFRPCARSPCGVRWGTRKTTPRKGRGAG